MADVSESPRYEVAVARYLAATEGLFANLASVEWQGGDVFLPLVARVIFCRQHEALASFPTLSAAGQGHVAAALLRPACEEWILLAYLGTLTREQGEKLVTLLARLEAAEDLEAQESYGGAESLRLVGFSERFTNIVERDATAATDELALLANELGWPRRGRRPSVRFFAERAGLVAEYDFLYHATSRFVHFKVKELLRRAWGEAGSIEISSGHYADHWWGFASYWGLWLHVHTTLEVLKLVDDIPDEILGEDFLEALKDLGPKVPIVTPREFVWGEGLRPWE